MIMMKIATLVSICLLWIGVVLQQSFSNYILCLHLSQKTHHLEERSLSDISLDELHVDLIQDEFASSPPKFKGFLHPKPKTFPPFKLNQFSFQPSFELKKGTPPDLLRTVRLIV